MKGNLIKTILLIVISVTLSTSCTHNNGDIGDWFGTWRMESLTIDGEADPAYQPPYLIWKFQGRIVQIIRPDDMLHEGVEVFGLWSEQGGVLSLDFDYDMGDFGWLLHLPVQADLDILKLTSRRIELEYVSEDGVTYTYKLKRWG